MGEKSMRPRQLSLERLDTAIGALLTQVVMCTMVVAFGTTTGAVKPQSIERVEDIVTTLAPCLGSRTLAKLVISCGMLGASLVAALVVSIAAAWSLAEAAGKSRPLDLVIREAPLFYGGYLCVLLLGMIVTLILGTDEAVKFNIGIQQFNAFYVPFIMVLLFSLAGSDRVLPRSARLKGWYKYTVAFAFKSVVIICCN